MAGAGYKLFNTGDVLLASEVNTYLQQQVTMVFANAAARTTALSGVLAEGMMSYLQDTNTVEVYNGTSWVNVGNAGDITEVQAGTGISVASGTGPIPVVTSTVATTFDAKGDLVVGTGADTFAKLTVGTNGYTLVADSAETTGLKWAAVSAGFSTFTTYTPTAIGGWTLGNGTLAAQYSVSGDLVWYRGMLTVGSTTSIGAGTGIGISLPFNIITTYDDAQYALLGNGFARDMSASVYAITSRVGSANQNDMFFNGQINTWSGSTPFTWANGDLLNWSVIYRRQ